MSTVIDAFVVTLGLDPSGWRKGQRDVREETKRTKEGATAAGKDIEAQGQKVASFLGNVRGQALGLIALFTGGLGVQQFARDTFSADAATGRLARNLGVATEELSAWQGLARQVGGTNADAEQSIQSLTKAFQDIQLTGQSPLIPYLQLLGVSLDDLRDPTQTLLKLSDAFSHMTPQRAQALGAGMGITPAMVTVLMRGRDATQALLIDQLRLGVTSKKQAEQAQRVQQAWDRMGQAGRAVGRELLNAVAPVLEWLVDKFTEFSEWAQKNKDVVHGAFAGLAAGAVVLAAYLAAPLLPALLLAGAFAAIGAAIAFLYDDFQKFKQGGPSAINWGLFISALDAVSGALHQMGDAAIDLGLALEEAYNAVPPEVWQYLGNALVQSLRGALQIVAGALEGVANLLRLLADLIRLVVSLLRGDWAQAWKDAGKVGADAVKLITDAWERAKKAASDYWAAIRGKKPDDVVPRPAPRPAPPVAANDAAPTGATPATFDAVRAFFRRQGWSETSARGIAAGAAAESRLNPNALNPTSGAYGIGQWLGSRVKDFERVMGRPLQGSTLDQQLRFMQWELNNTEKRAGSAIYGADSEHAALDAYVRRFMRPAKGDETTGDIARGRTALASNTTPPPAPAVKPERTVSAPPPPRDVWLTPPTKPGGTDAKDARLTPPERPGYAVNPSSAVVQRAQGVLASQSRPTTGAAASPAVATAKPVQRVSNDNRAFAETHIGEVVIHTAATDAPGIARDMHSALATQANRGLA